MNDFLNGIMNKWSLIVSFITKVYMCGKKIPSSLKKIEEITIKLYQIIEFYHYGYTKLYSFTYLITSDYIVLSI